jgi:hypothetical protein
VVAVMVAVMVAESRVMVPRKPTVVAMKSTMMAAVESAVMATAVVAAVSARRRVGLDRLRRDADQQGRAHQADGQRFQDTVHD